MDEKSEDYFEIGEINPRSYEAIQSILSQSPSRVIKTGGIITLIIIFILFTFIFIIKIKTTVEIPFKLSSINNSAFPIPNNAILLSFDIKDLYYDNLETVFEREEKITFYFVSSPFEHFGIMLGKVDNTFMKNNHIDLTILALSIDPDKYKQLHANINPNEIHGFVKLDLYKNLFKTILNK